MIISAIFRSFFFITLLYLLIVIINNTIDYRIDIITDNTPSFDKYLQGSYGLIN